MTTSERWFLFGVSILAAVTVEQMVMFLPPPMPFAAAMTTMAVTASVLIPGARPWYLVAPVTFAIFLCPSWVAFVALAVLGSWELVQRRRRKAHEG